ncbi:MAG: hypothetical protein M3014_07820, partial [Chloroflexota bacterium]|nr:hypothetical protein [Chloroflexota bacterium]
MESIASVWPILPGKLDAWRRFADEMQGARREEYDASSRRLGTTICRMYHQQTPQGDLAVVYLEAADMGRLFQGMATSQDPYDVWFREQVMDIHGWDVTQPMPGPLPEMVFEWQAGGHSTT